MATREIPRADWDRFLTMVSRQQADQPVRVRVADASAGDQTLADCVPMVGLSLEKKGSDADAIALTLAFSGGESHMTHQIANPAKLYVKENDAGEPEVLDIEDGAQVKTLIFFDAWSELPEVSG